MTASPTSRTPRSAEWVRIVERVGNRLPHPLILFAALALFILVISVIAWALGVSATHTPAGKPETTVVARNLLTATFLRDFLKRFVKIYVTFPPLGITMAIMIGVGVAEQSGLISALLRRTLLKAPPFLLTGTLALVAINANVASMAGVILIPTVGGALYRAAGRNPWLGIIVGYAAASGGFAANLMVSGTDAILAGITAQAATGLPGKPPVHPMINWYFMVTATFVVTGLVTFVTERIVGPALGDGQTSVEDRERILQESQVTPDERRGLRWAGIAALIYVALLIAGAVPRGGVLRTPEGTFLPDSALIAGIVPILFFFFLVTGLAFGYGSRKIGSTRDIPRLMEGGLRGSVSFLAVALAAAIFIHFFSESRLGMIIAIQGAQLLVSLNLSGLPLVLLFVVLVTMLNVFMPSGSAKWLLLAPIFVPMFALMDLSPAMTQLAFRVGDSATNVISPIKSYLPVIIGLLEQYRPDPKAEVGLGTIIALELPYAVALLIGLVTLLVVWYLLGLPLGPGAGIHL